MATKKVLTTGKFTFNSVAYAITRLRFNEAYSEVDVTDTGTTGDGKEYLGGRAERTFEVDLWLDIAASDLTLNSALALVMDFEGKTYSGTAVLLEKSSEASIDEGIKQTYRGRFNGTVTVSP